MSKRLPLKIVHIHRRTLALNIKSGRRDPVVIARKKYGAGVIRSNKIHVLDAAGQVAATIVCDIDKPLKCGARCYIETHNKIVNAEHHEEVL